MIEILLIAVALSMDCFAVSIAAGTVLKKPKLTQALKIGIFFGIFQAMMSLLGWAAGFGLQKFIYKIGHWTAIAILAAIGIKMIYEAFKQNSKEEESRKIKNIICNRNLFILAIATSIDAFATGVSFSVLQYSIFISVLIIGITAFMISVIGVYIGKKIGYLVGNKVEIIGGIILIGISVKILLEHLL